MAERAAQSFESSVTCSCVGISPVTKSQNKPSGSGSDPPGALGRRFWHSGIVFPRKRIPSSAAGANIVSSIDVRRFQQKLTCIKNGAVPDESRKSPHTAVESITGHTIVDLIYTYP